MTVTLEKPPAVCAQCGEAFMDRSRTSPRSYCYECRPVAGSPPAPLPFEKIPGEPFTVPHFQSWAGELTLDNGEPWDVEDFFCDFLEDFFAGYAEAWLLVPEGNTKTTSMSGLALYHCEFTDYARALWAASARDQAGLGYDQAEGFVTRSARLSAAFKCHPGYRRIAHRTNGSHLQIFAADDRTGDGVIPTLGLLDELHRHRNMKLYRTWRGKLAKRGGQLATFSTAGEPGGEFEETRDRIRQTSDDVRIDGAFTRAASKSIVLHDWSVPEGGDVEDMAVVKAANPFSGVTVDMLREKFESPTMTLAHWRRFACNLPTRQDSAAIQEAEWLAARTDEKIPKDEPVWVGLDVAWKWDTTAVVPLWFKDSEHRLFGVPRVIVPPRDGTSLDPSFVLSALAEIHARNPIHTVVMDMSRGPEVSSWIETEIGAVVVDRTQSSAMAVEDYDHFMEALRNGWLKHPGDPTFTRHVMNAVARVLPGGDAVFARASTTRQGGVQDQRVIDALTAAAMANSTAAMMEPAAMEPLLSWG